MRAAIAISLLVACGSRTQLDGAPHDASATSDAAPDVTIPLVDFPPSCQGVGPGLSDCGVDHDSCCTTLDVPGGTFFRTYDYDYYKGLEDEADPATVSAFRLDKYLVTVARFRLFASAWAHGWRPAAADGKHTHLNQGAGLANVADAGYEPGWNTIDDQYVAPDDANLSCMSNGEPVSSWTVTPAKQEAFPINCVNWYEAAAFCIWDGGFLPSETEWEFAAAGGEEQRRYPWGNASPANLSLSLDYGVYSGNVCSTWGPCCGCVGAKSAADVMFGVGMTSHGRAKWGHFDLAGELSEWTLDALAAYQPCTDCAQVKTDATPRISRGGDWVNPLALAQAWYRVWVQPAGRSTLSGFRCARRPAN